MQSWKVRKLRDEKRKAKRVERQKVAISHAKRKYMDEIIKGKSSEESKPMVDSRFLEKLRLSIRRSVFR